MIVLFLFIIAFIRRQRRHCIFSWFSAPALVAVQIKHVRLCLTEKKIVNRKHGKKTLSAWPHDVFFFFFWFTDVKFFTLRRLMGKHIYLYSIKGSTSLLPVLGNKQILPEASKVQTACQKPPNHTSTKLQSQH